MANTYSQNFAHYIGSGSTHFGAKFIEGFQISLVQRVTNNFNVHFIQILLGNTIDKEWSQWSVYQHGIVQFSWCGSNMYSFHLFKATQWMTLGNQFRNGSLVQSTSDQQNNIVNHIAIGDEVQETGQRLHSMIAHMLELNDQLFAQLVINNRNGQWWGFIGQKGAVICALQM